MGFMLVYTVLVPCLRVCPLFVTREKVKQTRWRNVQVVYMQVRGSKEVFRPVEEPKIYLNKIYIHLTAI